MSSPQISEDGRWMWDGNNWVPNPNLSQITTPVNMVSGNLTSQNIMEEVVSGEYKRIIGLSTPQTLVIIGGTIFIISIIIGAVFFFVFNTNPIVDEWYTEDKTYWEFKNDGTVDMVWNGSSVWGAVMENCSISTTWEQGSLEWELILDFKWYCPGAEGIDMKMMWHYKLTNKNTILWLKTMAMWDPDDNGGNWDYEGGDSECSILLRKDLAHLYENDYALGKAAAENSDSRPNWC